MELWLELALVALLVLLNAAFAGSEMAFISLREGQLGRLEARGGTGRVLARLARNPNRFLSTIQIGITLAGFFASATAAVSLSDELEGPLDFLGGAARPVAVVSLTLILSYFTLVFGELAPKRVAMQRAEGWALLAARPISFLARVSRPIVWLLSASTDIAVRILGADPSRQREVVTEEEIRDLLAAQNTFSVEQRTVISSAFDLDHRALRDVLVARTHVFALPAAADCPVALRSLVQSGHSRAPTYGNDLDDLVGVVHLRDLVLCSGTVREHARPAVLLPESASVLDALRRLREERQQMAIVINEYGGVEGIVTVEDLVEEFVGEIYDEFDRDVLTARREPDGSVLLPGTFPMHDLKDLEIVLPAGNYSTVAGLVLQELGRIPESGASVAVDDWNIEVVAADERSIKVLRLRPAESPVSQ